MSERSQDNGGLRAQIVGGIFVVVAAVVAGLFQYFTPRASKVGVPAEPSIYELRVIVIGPNGVPVDDAKVWSSVGGEPKHVPGGWQFDIPSAATRLHRRVIVFAAKDSAFLNGKTELELGQDSHPAISVQLTKVAGAAIHGIVVDGSGRGLDAVRVAVVGSERNGVTTQTDGHFFLEADAAEGEQVLVRVEKDMYAPVTQWHPAGRQPLTIILEKHE
jgi:hypothetical protein